MLLLGLVVLWAGGVFKVKTADGILVVQVNEPNAEVFVDGDRMTVSWNDGGTKAEIHVKPGTRKVEVKKDGFGVDGTDLTFRDGDREVFTARLLPEQVAKADQPPQEKPAPPDVPPEKSPPPPDAPKPAAPPVAGAADDDKGFVPLFNGKDLTGWSVAPIETGNYQGWVVEDGALVAHGDNFKTRNFLFTDREYADFVLRLEFIFDEGGSLSSGVGLRAIPGEKLPAYGRLIQDYPVLKLGGAPGAAAKEETGTISWVLDGFDVKPDRSADLLPPGSWNRLEIEVKGRTIRTSVNGKQILDAALAPVALLSDGSVPALGRPKGRIGLQKHTGTIRFLHIRIKELPPADAAAPPAPAADGFVSLFNGKDLTGWQGLVPINERAKLSPEELAKKQKEADEKDLPHWTVQDGILVYDGKGDNLQTVKDYGDFELYVDWKIPPKGDSGIYLRGNPQVQIWDSDNLGEDLKKDWHTGSGGLWNDENHPNQPLVKADNPIGEWNTFHIIMKGDKVTVWLNGKKVVDDTPLENYWEPGKPLPATGPIELQHHGDKLWFKNIYIKELTPADAAAPPVPAGDGFVPLFNGKDLTGWAGLEDFWSVKDGVISGHETKEGSKQTDFVLTAMQPADFELHFSYKFATPDGNSGVQVRSKVLDEPTYRVGGCQADFDAKGDYDGSFYDEAGDRGTMSSRGEKTIWDARNQRHNEKLPGSGDELKKVVKVGDWNDCVIVAKGSRITYTINGRLTTDLIDDSPKALKEGVIALQLHAGFTMEVLFKDIKIKVLPPSQAEDQGFVPLFNGKNLTGWQVFNGKEEVWAAEDGLLVTEGGGGGWLMTEQEYADFEVRLEFKLSEECNSGVAFAPP